MTINEYNKDSQFSDSGLTLISADQVEFRIHKYKLQAASSVFQVMFEASSTTYNDRLELTDETIENAKILSMFLKVIYGKKLEPPASQADVTSGYQPLVSFIVKYDASAAKEHIRLSFQLWAVTNNFSPHGFFLFAPELGCPEVATAAIKYNRNYTWTGPADDVEKREALLQYGLKDENTLNLAALSYNRFMEIPHEYLFAWLRARENTWGTSKPRTDYKAVGEEFEKIIGYFTSDNDKA